ncbi:MAG: LPS-assembly protein LptD [Bacteroidales bacterium]|nr:LPS-assembly protein LptD [Bacteroidales bacterium]
MHFRLLLLCIIINHAVGFANSVCIPTTTIAPISQLSDTLNTPDTLKSSQKKESALDQPIFTNASDSTIYSLDGKTAYLYGNAVVTYDNLELKAQYIEFDMQKKQAFACGLPDSTGKIIGKPVFKEGSQSYQMDSIHYNFESKRAKINGVITEQSGGFMHSEVTKKMENNVVNMLHGKYTTCDLEHPHYYIAITKGKMIPDKKIISGPAYIVIADVPFPIFIPFGFFPYTKKRAAGIILPEFNEGANTGVSLRGLGFYFGMGDYMDQKFTTDLYTTGSWALYSATNYRVRYKYSGSLNLGTSTTVSSEKGLPDYAKTNAFRVNWNHSQDSKANPNTTFQANVSFSTSNYYKYNAKSLNDALTNTINSSVSYSKTWAGTPFSLNTSLSHSQNNINSVVNIGFPKVTFNMARIYPFKQKVSTGTAKWYEKIGLSLTTNLNNSVEVKESNLFKKSVVDSMRNGMKHDIPLSTSFNMLKFITVSPGVSYSEYWYIKTIEKHWDPYTQTVAVDTINGFKRGYQYGPSVSMSTKVYGTFQFKKTSKVQAIRHVITPSVSLSYKPDFADPKYGFYKKVQKGTNGAVENYSIFSNGILGGPQAGESGSISFALNNMLEMKVRSDKDTANPVRKIKILEGLSFNTSYNMLADSLNWSDISVSGRTNLLDKVNINFSGGFCPYAINAAGTKINQYEYNNSGKFARFTRGSVGLDFSLSSSAKNGQQGGSGGSKPGGISGLPGDSPGGIASDGSNFGESMSSQYGTDYVDFSVPWSLNFRYTLSYSKPAYETTITQTASLSGELSLTPKLRIGFSTNYDIKNKQLTSTSLNFFRDLHCWEMRMTIVPLGYYKSFSFQINVKSSMLQDLKYNKRESYLDKIE